MKDSMRNALIAELGAVHEPQGTTYLRRHGYRAIGLLAMAACETVRISLAVYVRTLTKGTLQSFVSRVVHRDTITVKEVVTRGRYG